MIFPQFRTIFESLFDILNSILWEHRACVEKNALTSFCTLLEHFLEGLAALRHWYVHKPKWKLLTYQSLNRKLPTRKYFIRHLLNANDLFISLLTEIYLHWNERLGHLAPSLFSAFRAHSRKKNLAIIVVLRYR